MIISAQQRIGLIAASAVAALIAIAVWLSRPPPAPEPLTIAVSNSFIGIPLWVADRQGFFTAAGLTVTLPRRPTGKLALEATLRGEAEVATVAETPLVFAALAGKPLRVIATYAGSGEHAIVARADRGISQVADLRGRRVGVIVGTTAQYFLHVMLGFNLAVDQGFVMLLQSEAQWAIASGLAPGRTMPDFPAMIDAAILARLRPGSVTVTGQP